MSEIKKPKNRFELDPERLATTDEKGNRVYLYPEDVKGVWKTRRQIVYWALIALYLTLPWIYINGRPALMANIFKREFSFFGAVFYGVDPLLFFLITISAIFLIAFLTSLYGRVWCGWACPQTVFIQTIFQKIEQILEGSARKRRELDESPLSFKKVFLKISKWIIFAFVSLHIAHTFIGYLIGPKELLNITMHSPLENWEIFIPTMILSGIFLFDFGWFREQFCIIACPYGRMQSVIMDSNSLVVAYDTKRGEPRRGLSTDGTTGDCINCYNCVKVCPTGIDIRRGTQLECIACTNCIDACDEIMEKVHKPKGLIRYSTENELNGQKRQTITPRSILYAIISLIFVACFVLFINSNSKIKVHFLRNHEPYTLLESEVTNRFNVSFSQQSTENKNLALEVENNKGEIEVILPGHIVHLNKPNLKRIVFFKFDKSLLENGSKKINVITRDADTKEILNTQEVTLVGPTH